MDQQIIDQIAERLAVMMSAVFGSTQISIYIAVGPHDKVVPAGFRVAFRKDYTEGIALIRPVVAQTKNVLACVGILARHTGRCT